MSDVKCMNPWDPQSKRQYQIDGVYCALNAGHAIGGQAHGICYAIEGNTVDRASMKNGRGWCENVSPTLNTQDRHAVCFQENRTPIIVMEGNGARPSHMGNGYRESDVMYTLNTIEQHSVCYAVDCRNNCLVREMSSTLQAKPQGGWSVNITNPLLIVNGDEKH